MDECVEEGFDAEVGECASEEDGAEFSGEECLAVEGGTSAVEEFEGVAEVFVGARADFIFEGWIVEVAVADGDAVGSAVGAFKLHEALVPSVIDADEVFALSDWPGGGGGGDAEDFFDFGKEFEGVASLTVHFVDECDDGDAAHAADLEEFYRLWLDALDGVEEHDGGIGGGKGAVGVLAEIVVSRGVEEVHLASGPDEVHDGGRDGDAAFLLHGHPVAGGMSGTFSGLDGSGGVDGPSVEEELFGEGCFAGVRMRDDCKCAPFLNFFGVLGHVLILDAVVNFDDGFVEVFEGGAACLGGIGSSTALSADDFGTEADDFSGMEAAFYGVL